MLDVTKKYKVVLTDARWADLKHEEKYLMDIADIHRYNCKSENELILNCTDADALLVTYASITKKVINNLKNCKVISVYGIGTDMVDVRAATEAGIFVTNVPGYCIEEVCDHAMALLMTSARKILSYHQGIVNGGPWNYQVAKPIYRLRGKTLGLIGFGKIPRAVAERAKSFGLNVIAFDPYVTREMCDRLGVVKTELDALLQQSDFISIHTPLTPETKGLFNEKRFRMMKRGAVVINTSRGQIIEEQSLIKALQEGWIAGAALDVLQNEPPTKDNPLLNMNNVILTPHAGFYSEEAGEDLRLTAALEVRKVLMGQRPDYLINSDVLKYISREKKRCMT